MKGSAPLTNYWGKFIGNIVLLTRKQPRTDRPKVPRQKMPKTHQTKPSDLIRVCADILAELTGQAPPRDEELHDFVHDAYQAYFHKSWPGDL